MSDTIKSLLITWAVVVSLNQVILYHACFKLHCIIAAIPHTFVIAFVINLILQDKKN
jgi:hypothetical protein